MYAYVLFNRFLEAPTWLPSKQTSVLCVLLTTPAYHVKTKRGPLRSHAFERPRTGYLSNQQGRRLQGRFPSPTEAMAPAGLSRERLVHCAEWLPMPAPSEQSTFIDSGTSRG